MRPRAGATVLRGRLIRSVRAFSTLTPGGQVRRLRPVAAAALARFGLGGGALRPVQHGENTVFRVDAPSGMADRPARPPYVPGRFALRVHGIDYQDAASIRSELEWLQALAGEGRAVPEPLRTPAGDLVVGVEAPGALGTRQVSVLRWVAGRAMHEPPPPGRYRAAGAAVALLHDHAAGWVPPPGFRRHRWDWEGLFGASITFAGTTVAEAWREVPQLHRRRWRRAAERYRHIEEDLTAAGLAPGLIHGDPHYGNQLYAAGEARLVDFDDCGWGWELYDAAVALGRASRVSPRWDEIHGAFWDGYQRHRAKPGPDLLRHLDGFIAARAISVSLWAFGMIRINPDFARYVPGLVADSEELLDTIRAS